MTAHDQETVTGSYDESRTAAEETPQVNEHTAAADPSTASPQPSAPQSPAPAPVGQEAEPFTAETLFADDELADLRARWAGVQAAFVDDPKDCVQKADVLVSDLIDHLTSSFAHARSRLEEQWARGGEASTEDLRLALMHYREFFERLLVV